MARLVGFFLLCLVVLQALRWLLGGVPVIGHVLGMPLIGFYVVAIGLSALLSRRASLAVDRRRQRALVRSLGAVDTPRNQGKLGALQASQGRWRAARAPLEAAVAGEPDVAEWAYRLGQVRLETGDRPGAEAELARCLELDEEYGYGSAMLLASRAALEAGDAELALQRAERFERNHGPSPESGYRRGRALAALGRGYEARAAYAAVGEAARSGARYQKGAARGWVLRAWWAQVTG